MSFVPMAPGDVDAVTALEQRIQAFPWSCGNFVDSLAAGHEGWVQREGDRLLSFAVTMLVVDEVHLLVIGVSPELQRLGLGTQLLDFLCARACRSGAGRMLLEVRAANDKAISFYRGREFVEIGRRRGYYPTLDGREDAIVMARIL